MPEFADLNNDQLFEQRSQIHDELGYLLGVRTELSANRPNFYGANGEPDNSGYYDRLTEVEIAIDACTQGIHKIWTHFMYRGIKDDHDRRIRHPDIDILEKAMFSEPEENVHLLEIEAATMPGGEQSRDPELSMPFSEYVLHMDDDLGVVEEQQAA